MTIATKILLRRCTTCDTHYEHTEGGACAKCERVFCGKHLHGPWAWWRRRQQGYRPVCRQCRQK
ncbi:MAG: hypothetical protein ABI836_00580 [Gemmatimonadota bacterium]